MPWGNDALRFLKRVIAWPASEQDAGYGNIHFTVPNEHKRAANAPDTYMNGMPFKSAEAAWNYISKIYIKPNTRDIYFCTSLQAQTKLSKNQQYEVGHRHITNTLGSKALFLDIDIKPDKGYPTLKQAIEALALFRQHWKLPAPTALVGSGGGLHCYWISNRFLTPDEWKPLAEKLRAAAVQHGLRCDGQCTIDITRILRVPETRNWKTTPPRQTRLIHLAEQDLDFAAELIPALDAVPALALVPTTSRAEPAEPAALLFDPKLFPKRAKPAMYKGVETGAEGLEPEAPILDTKEIFKQCPWLREALRTGGEHHDNPQWRLALVASTFLPNGRLIAHKISDRHPKFTEGEFDEQYTRAENDVKAMNMGYPSCASIEQNGSKQCVGCPLRGKIRSPLNTGIVRKPLPAPVTPSQGATTTYVTHTPTSAQPFDPRWLPEGHVFNEKGIPCIVKTVKEKTADGETEDVETFFPMLYEQRIFGPYVQETPRLALGFEVDGNEGRMRQVYIENGATANTNQTIGVLREQGVHPHRMTKGFLGDFLMELARKMEMLRRSIDAKPAGWIADAAGKLTKFAYGGTTYKADGTTEPSGFLDAQMRRKFNPQGVAAPWMKVAQLFVSQRHTDGRTRVDIQVLLAGAFAGPLMIFTGQKLGVLMVVGESGSGKSTLMKATQAVWGNPDEAILTQNPTDNSLAHIMGTVSNLPVVWDDITQGPPQEALCKTLMQDGKERERLLSKNGFGLMVREQMKWDTMLICTSNFSFIDFLASKGSADTGAKRYRVFEITGVDKGQQIITFRDMDQMMIQLRQHHGVIGQAYAKYLAENSQILSQLVQDRGREFDKLVKATNQERYWSYTCACLLLGAEIAAQQGYADFDLVGMKEYLVQAFLDLRQRVKDDLQEGVDVAIETLSGFIKAHSNQVLVTDRVPMKGRNAKPINIFVRPHQLYSKNVAVQFVDRPIDPVCRIDRAQLQDWLDKKKIPSTMVYGRLKKGTFAVLEKIGLGAGTEHASGRERALELKIAPGSWLEEIMRDMRGQRQREDETPPPAVTAPVTETDAEQGILDAAAVAKVKDAAA